MPSSDNFVQRQVGGYVGMVAVGEGRVQKRRAISYHNNAGERIDIAIN